MKHIFYLSGDFIDLGKEEVMSLFEIKYSKLLKNLLITNLNNNSKSLNNVFPRLALTKSIYKLLFECKTDDLIGVMKSFDWNSVYKGNFCIRVNYVKNKKEENGFHSLTIAPRQTLLSFRTNSIKQNLFKYLSVNKRALIKLPDMSERERALASPTHSLAIAADSGSAVLSEHAGSNSLSDEMDLPPPASNFTERNLAAYIWHSLKSPKVNLKNPKTLVQLFIAKNKAYCGLLVYSNKEDFEKRKSHLRPFPHPSSLHPKVARALVNITGIGKNEILLDPFCGTGGFLIESGLMGIKTIGYDINKIMIDGCIENLKHYNIKKYKIKNKNALDINDKFDYLVTDLPYGLNSNVILQFEKGYWKKHRINKKIQKKGFIRDLEEFYLLFLKNLRKKLKKKAVIVFPDYANYRRLLKLSKFKIEREFEQYVHRSLTRKIVAIN